MTRPDRELRSRAEELAYLEQRFDIHVLAFADQSDSTAHALQVAFAVDFAAAQRMLAATPVVVKRAATPEVAGALLDALNKIGAQVVLLPAPPEAEPSLPPAAAAEPAPPAPAPAARPAAAAASPASPANAAGWGALDLQLSAPARRALPLESAPPQRSNEAELEESLDGNDASDPEGAEFGELGESGEPYLHSSAPPVLTRSARTTPVPQRDGPLLELDAGELELPGAAAPVVSSAPPRAARSPRPPAPPPPPPVRAPELGLGTVPPLPPAKRGRSEFLPLMPSAGAPPPLSMAPRLPPVASRPPAPPPPAPAPRPAEPRRGATPTRTRPNPSQPRLKTAGKTAGKAAGGAAKRPASKPDLLPASPARQAFERDPFPAPGLPTAKAEFPMPPQPNAARAHGALFGAERPRADSPKPPAPVPNEARARGHALMLLLGSLLGIGLGLYVGDSVLQGGASLLSIGLHGVALYGFGVGLAGLRP